MYAMNQRYHDVSLYTYVEENLHTLRILYRNTQTRAQSNRINTKIYVALGTYCSHAQNLLNNYVCYLKPIFAFG